MKKLKEELKLLVRSRYPIIYLLTFEEERAERVLKTIADDMKKELVIWSVTNQGKTKNAEAAAVTGLDEAINIAQSAIFIFRDLHTCMDDPIVVRRLRDLATEFARAHKTLVIISPVMKIPMELEKDITILDLPLPDRQEIESILNDALGFAEKTPKLSVSLTHEDRNAVIDSALGLSLKEAKRIFSKAMLTDHVFNANDIDLILEEKKQLIRKSETLEYFDSADTVADIGGLENVKQWLTQRKASFTQKARDYGLASPKGLLLLGVQGCGKSLTAKAVAGRWNQPLLRLDMGKIFSSYIGSSEENMRKAITTAESLAPVVLWIDEIEKGLAGVKSSGSGDSGVSARIFGTFLNWMQEKQKPVFVIATANSIANLPPELLRKGRFDEIFFIDLPQRTERKEIFEIHIRKRKRDPAKYDLDSLAENSDGFSGAEIEMAIVEAMYKAFDANREFVTEDILESTTNQVPLSTTMAEDIGALRQWALKRARPASLR